MEGRSSNHAETGDKERPGCCSQRKRHADDDAMATEKTAEGIRKFAVDIVKLERFIAAKIGS